MSLFINFKINFLALPMVMGVLCGCAATTPMRADFKKAPVVAPFHDRYWLLLEDLKFEAIREIDNKYFSITIPAGFVTDLASIPVPLNLIYNKTGSYAAAGILHDYLYWTQFCQRHESDRFIKEGLKASGSGFITRNTIKYGVYLFGWGAWDKNQEARQKGEERFVPESMRQFSAQTKWEDYKKAIDPKIAPPWNTDKVRTDVQSGCDIFDIHE